MVVGDSGARGGSGLRFSGFECVRRRQGVLLGGVIGAGSVHGDFKR